MPSNQMQALLECGCGCGNVCDIPCCPGFNVEDATLDNTGYEPGGLGCPDITACLDVSCDNGMRMNVTSPDTPEYVELFEGHTICAIFASVGTHSIPGLVGFFEVEAVVACIDGGGTYKGFVRYSLSPTLSIPTGVWIETTAGWTCPDCDALGSGAAAYATLYWDAFVDCSVCSGVDYDYGPPESCIPDTIWSIRYHFRGYGTCI